MTDTTDSNDDNNVTISKAEYDAMQANTRMSMAQLAGADLNNPTTELVMKEHWTPTVSVDDMKAVVEKYNIGVKAPVAEEGEGDQVTPDPEPKVPEVSGPPGTSDVRGNLANGTSAPGTSPGMLDPKAEALKAFKKGQEEGLSDEDSRVLALHANLTNQGNVQAAARIAERRQDEERVAAAMAAREAAEGVGNI